MGAASHESFRSSPRTRERHFSGGIGTRNLGENLGVARICHVMSSMSKLGTTFALVLVLCAAGCVRSDRPAQPGLDERLSSLKRAIDSLQQASSEEKRLHREAWERIEQSTRPSEIELWLSYFDDPRLTELLESIDNNDGLPVEYTIGDALYFVF